MPSKRDLLEKSRQNQAKKADVKPRYRSVICAADGSRSTGSQWADEDAKVVWHQLFGSGGIGRARCTAIANPELGLGVEVSKIDDRLAEWEVVGDDPFLRRSATDSRNYGVTSPQDLQPGGRLMLWVDSRQLTPLATYDTAGTLEVNVVSGDYPYLGTRKTFTGAVNQDLTSRVPGAGLTRYVGLYLDSANALQFVNGATTTIGLAPAEPTWPAGAFRLSVVQLDNAQASLSFADDIFDRRMIWSDEQGGAIGGWPLAKVLTVSATNPDADYTNIADAIAAASTGDVILIDAGTYTITVALALNKAITLLGIDPVNTIIACATNSVNIIDISVAGASVRNLTLSHTGAGTAPKAITVSVNSVVLEDLFINMTGAPSSNWGIYQTGGNTTALKIINCFVAATGGSGGYAYANENANAKAEIYGGSFNGSLYDIYGDQAGSTVIIITPILVNNLISVSGTARGQYFDATGKPIWLRGASAFAAHKNGTDQTGIVSLTWTKLTATTESFDAEDDYDAANSKHTPLVAGYYMYACATRWASSTDQAQLIVSIYKNGAELKRGGTIGNGTSFQHLNVVAMVEMNGSSDYVEFYVLQDTGSNRTIEGASVLTHIQGALLKRS